MSKFCFQVDKLLTKNLVSATRKGTRILVLQTNSENHEFQKPLDKILIGRKNACTKEKFFQWFGGMHENPAGSGFLRCCNKVSGTFFRLFVALLCVTGLIVLITRCGGGSTQSLDPTGDVLTYHNDNLRTGENLQETVLTPKNVNSTGFGKVFSYSVDGAIFAQPLYVKNVPMGAGGVRNVVYVVTEHDSVYAFDADQKASGPLWHDSFVNPGSNVTTVPCADEPNACDALGTEIGITSTPVIDPDTETLYVCAFTKEPGGYTYRLHALNLSTGSEKFGGPVRIRGSVPGTGDQSDGKNVDFSPYSHLQRSALLLANGAAYVAFASFGDARPYHGWIFAFDSHTLQTRALLNLTPNGNAAGIWEGGNGPASDRDGNIYVVTGNGTFDADAGGQDFGNSFVRIMQKGRSLSVVDSFTPFNYSDLNARDYDLGAGGPLLLPDQAGNHPHLMLAGGKEGTLYLVDRDNMGHFRAGDNSQIVQSLVNIVGQVYCTPAYWENKVYFVGIADSLKVFTLNKGLLSTAPTSHSAVTFGIRGATPSVSANGSKDGIVWVLDTPAVAAPAVLVAYDANDVSNELYDSEQAGTRDALPTGVRFGVPTVANGKVYVRTLSELDVFGLLH